MFYSISIALAISSYGDGMAFRVMSGKTDALSKEKVRNFLHGE